METAAKIYEEGKKEGKDVVQVNPAWVLEESLKSLSSKFPILPRSQGSLIFCTTPLSNKLESKPEDALFDLSDTNVLQYNVLHDPHLREYFQNTEIKRRLVDQGFITEDGYVKCNLVEFNNYRKWIRKLKLEELYKQRSKQRMEEINDRNDKLMQKKMEREKESLYILRERENKAKEYVKKRKEKREMERLKYMSLEEVDKRRRDKKKKERKTRLDDAEELRERRQVERKVEKTIQEDKKRRVRLRIVYKRKQDDTRRETKIVERRRLGRWQRENELKKQWKRRCTIALGNISEQWKEEKRLLDLRERNIERRAKMFERRQNSNQAAVTNFVTTRRATLQQEFLEAEEFLNKLRLKKDIEIANWKRKHQRMLSRGSSLDSFKAKGSTIEISKECMALRRWSAPDRTGFRKPLKSTWDLKSSLIKDLEEELPVIPREQADQTKDEKYRKDSREREYRNRVRALIWHIISNAYHILEDENKRCAAKGTVEDIIHSAVAVVEKENIYKRNKTCVRRYVFSIIEAASQMLERERIEVYKAKLMEEEATAKKFQEQLNQVAGELVSTAMVFAKRIMEKDLTETSIQKEKDLKESAKCIVGEAIDRARYRYIVQVQDIRRVSSESLPESVTESAQELEYESNLDWAVRNIVSDAVVKAVDSVERFYYEESDIMEAATGLMKSAIINAKESLETMYRVTPALEEQISRIAWRLANRALISAENSLEKLKQESVKQAAQDLASHAILSAQNSFARMEEQMLCETAEELALQAIMTAQKSMWKSEEEEFFSEELARRAILEAKASLIKADEMERTSCELARQAIESAQATFQDFSQDRTAEATKIAVSAAQKCIGVYKSQENLTPQNELVANEALNLAIQAIQSSVHSLEELQTSRKSCVLTDGSLLSSVMQYVEGVIVRALQELDSNRDINVLKPGNIRPDEYAVLARSDTDMYRKPTQQRRYSSLHEFKTDEMGKPGPTNRRRTSVHFSTRNIFSSRRDSLSKESEFLPVRNRPPTPRFIGRKTFSNQMACASWDNLEQELKGIEKKDKVKVLSSSREGSPKLSDIKRYNLRRFSSDQGIQTREKPVIVSFQISHSASDSYFRRASESQDVDVAKEMLVLDKESFATSGGIEHDTLGAKEHQECEFDTLVSMTNTPEPQVSKDVEVDIWQSLRSAEERIPCHITPRSSSYILLPKLESHEKVLLQAKVSELEQVHRRSESSLTHLPAVSPTPSLVVVQEPDECTPLEGEKVAVSTEEQTNLPKISKSGSLVSMDGDLSPKDQEPSKTASKTASTTLKPSHEGVESMASSEELKKSSKTLIEATQVSPGASSEKVKPLPSRDVTKVSPKPSTEGATISPTTSRKSVKIERVPSSEAVKVSSSKISKISHDDSSEPPKITTSHSSDHEAVRVSPIPPSEVVKVAPTPSVASAKLSTTTPREDVTVPPKTSRESIKISPVPSTEAAKISPKPSTTLNEDITVSPKTSRESAKISPAPSTETAKISLKPSSETAKVSPKASSEATKLTPVPSTEAAKISPKPSSETAKVSPKASSEATKLTPVPSTEATKVSPTASTEPTKMSSKDSSETVQILPDASKDIKQISSSEKAKVSPKPSSKAVAMTPVPSTEATKASPKTSSEVVKLSLKASSDSTKILPTTPSKVTKVASKSSTVSLKLSTERTESMKMKPVDSTESAKKLVPKASSDSPKKIKSITTVEEAKITPKPSAEVKKLMSTTSGSANKITPTKSTGEAKITPTPSCEAAKLPSKTSSDSMKMTHTPSSEQMKLKRRASSNVSKVSSELGKLLSTPSTEETKTSPKPFSEDAKLSPKTSSASMKLVSKSSSEKAKVSPKPSTDAAKVLSKTSTTSSKMTPRSSIDTAKVSPKPSTEVAKLSPKSSSATTQMTPKPSSEAAKVSPEPSKDAAKLPPKTSSVSVKMGSKVSKEEAKVSKKPSSDATKLSSKMSSQSTKTTAKPSEETKLSPKPSTDATTVPTKTSSTLSAPTSSTGTAKVSEKLPSEAKPSTKTSNESTKITAKPSKEAKAKLSSSEVSSEPRKMTTKPSQEMTKGSTKSFSETTLLSSKASREFRKMTHKSSLQDSKLSHSSETMLSPKVSRESSKKKTRKHSRGATKVSSKHSGETVKLPTKASSQSTKTTSEASSPEASQVVSGTSLKEVPKVTKVAGESSDVSPRTSHESAQMSTKTSTTNVELKPKAPCEDTMPTTEEGKETSSTSGSAERISRRSSRKTSKVKPTSLSLTKVSVKTSTHETKASASASIVSTYVIPTSSESETKDSVVTDSKTVSCKSLNGLQTQSLPKVDKESSHEKMPPEIHTTDSPFESKQKERTDVQGDRRISLCVPDPVVALKGVGRRVSLPGGVFSEHELDKRRLSSLQDISESKESHQASTTEDSSSQIEDQAQKDDIKTSVQALTVCDAENRRLSLMHSIPSITIQEPASPPNEDNVLFEEDERVRIISELDHAQPVSSGEQISINYGSSNREHTNSVSDNGRTSETEAKLIDPLQQSEASLPDTQAEKVSDILKGHRSSTDIDSSRQTGIETKRQSVACIGIQFSPTSSKEQTYSNRVSDTSLKTRIARGSISKLTNEGIGGIRTPLCDSFELKGIGLGGGTSSAKSLISSRSTEFPRTQPWQGSRGHFSSHSLDTPLSRGVIVTALKPSPPLSPRLIESSARRSRLKMALSETRAKETRSETSLSTSSKSDASEGLPKKPSDVLLGSNSSVTTSLASKESTKNLPERPSSASSMLKREKIKASRTIVSSSSSERSDTAGRASSEGKIVQQTP